MARRYVLADPMFPHRVRGELHGAPDLVAGTDYYQRRRDAEVDVPERARRGLRLAAGHPLFYRCPSVVRLNGPVSCFTIGDDGETLDRAGVSWKYYATPLSRSPACGNRSRRSSTSAYGPDWKEHHRAADEDLDGRPDGELAVVSWVTPD